MDKKNTPIISPIVIGDVLSDIIDRAKDLFSPVKLAKFIFEGTIERITNHLKKGDLP